MSVINTFPGLIGFYVLTPDGQLGFFDRDNKFVVDDMLTKTFNDYNMRFLMAYLRNPEQGNFRLAIIHRSQEQRPWGADSVFLEKHIVRRLYPIAGMTTDVDLTSFQKKNREKSIYRGMELFLEYKDGSNPDMPIYCPVLYDRGTMLDSYASILDRQATSADRELPVVEVINLLAAVPVAKRNKPEIGILKEKIYQGSVKKGMRKSAEFTLIEDMRHGTENAKERIEHDPYGDADKRLERKVTLDSMSEQEKNTVGDAEDERIRSIGGRSEPADVSTLKTFARFRDMDHEKLVELAAQCFMYTVPPGTKLLERGTNDTMNLYLLEGTLSLTAGDGGEKQVDGGTGKASNPISSLKPRMYSVTTVTRVVYLWIDDKLVERVIGTGPISQRRDGVA